jgi:hypothetical protein
MEVFGARQRRKADAGRGLGELLTLSGVALQAADKPIDKQQHNIGPVSAPGGTAGTAPPGQPDDGFRKSVQDFGGFVWEWATNVFDPMPSVVPPHAVPTSEDDAERVRAATEGYVDYKKGLDATEAMQQGDDQAAANEEFYRIRRQSRQQYIESKSKK